MTKCTFYCNSDQILDPRNL